MLAAVVHRSLFNAANLRDFSRVESRTEQRCGIGADMGAMVTPSFQRQSKMRPTVVSKELNVDRSFHGLRLALTRWELAHRRIGPLQTSTDGNAYNQRRHKRRDEKRINQQRSCRGRKRQWLEIVKHHSPLCVGLELFVYRGGDRARPLDRVNVRAQLVAGNPCDALDFKSTLDRDALPLRDSTRRDAALRRNQRSQTAPLLKNRLNINHAKHIAQLKFTVKQLFSWDIWAVFGWRSTMIRWRDARN
jgi:hypothetical protein